MRPGSVHPPRTRTCEPTRWPCVLPSMQRPGGGGSCDVARRGAVDCGQAERQGCVGQLHQLRKPTPRFSSHNASALSTATKPSISAYATQIGTSELPNRP